MVGCHRDAVAHAAPTGGRRCRPAPHGADSDGHRQGLIDGYPPPFDGPFRPEGATTRAQAVKMVALVAQLLPQDGPTPLGDVRAGDWFAPFVAAGYAARIAQGETGGTFGPDMAVTREAFAALLARALHLTGTARLTFADADRIGAWAPPAVEAVVAAGYFEGFAGGAFGPLQPLTRAQAAQPMAKVIAGLAPPPQT